MAEFSPDRGEIFGIQTGLRGWSAVDGLGPNYFLSDEDNKALRAFVGGRAATPQLLASLAAGRASVVNFFDFLTSDTEFRPSAPAQFAGEVTSFLAQYCQQVRIWKGGSFRAFDFSQAEIEILARISAKASPVLFYMGFADAIPHSSQVSRLCASMAHSLHGRHSEVFQAAVVGKLHDPKFEPRIDVGKQNLATHPIVAVALANSIFDDPWVYDALLEYFHGNTTQTNDFIVGVQDALGVNNDSRFVQMFFVLPQFTKRIGDKYGPKVAEGFRAVMEGRLESAAKQVKPTTLPWALHGCLAQETLDSGLRGISQQSWRAALAEAGVETGDPVALFHQVMSGDLGTLTQEQIAKIRASVRGSGVLKALISATRLLHHHQEVVDSGRVAATALVIADPMMLSPHKVAAVYVTPVYARLQSYITSFDDNVRLLPNSASNIGGPWQRAVLLGMLLASDKLTKGGRMAAFEAAHKDTPLTQDIDDLRTLLLSPETWGVWGAASGTAAASAEVQQALVALEEGYLAVVNGYRTAVQSGQPLEKFVPSLSTAAPDGTVDPSCGCKL